MEQLLGEWRNWLISGGILLVAILLALVVHGILYRIAARVGKQTGGALDDSLVRHSRAPTRLILPMLAVLTALPALPLGSEIVGRLEHLAQLILIGGIGWAVLGFVDVLNEIVSTHYRIDIEDNLAARRMQTRFRVLRRVMVVLVAIITVAVMLLTFPSVRQVGLGLLGSAGLAGIVVGMAARPTLSNIVAGIQIALTEPIRIDDVVIVEGEWGRIEEITAAYVVVRIWDLRRLIVPLSHFIQEPFQNWTRQSADILGTVFLYADYTVPVEEVRQELHRIVGQSGMWDGKVWGLQVTNATEHTMELRALMSAADSSTAWNLRCHVREKLIEFLQRNHPGALPRARAELLGNAPSVAATSGGQERKQRLQEGRRTSKE